MYTRQWRFRVTLPASALLLGGVFAFMPASSVNASVVTVDDNGQADYNTIQAAINAANDGDEIRVFAGVYTNTGEYVIDLKGKQIDIVAVNGPSETIIDGEYARRCVICTTNENRKTLIRNFTIANGIGTWVDLDNDGKQGNFEIVAGGAFIQSASPKFSGCFFVGNSADVGGAVFGESTDVEFDRCTFTDNLAIFGAAISFDNLSFPEVQECTFSNNLGAYSGALELQGGSDATIESCAFFSNQAVVGGSIISHLSAPVISNSYFSINLANSGGAIHLSSGADAVITDCSFDTNTTLGDGGAISCFGCNPTIDGTSFINNAASDFGGAIHAAGKCTLEFTNLIATDNRAYGGGAIACETSTILGLTASTFQNNDASWEGNAIRNDTLSAALISDSSFCGEGNDHIEGLWIDLGGNSFASSCTTIADINGDGLVNGGDLLIVLADWGNCSFESECAGDLDENGRVDGADLLYVLSKWTN